MEESTAGHFLRALVPNQLWVRSVVAAALAVLLTAVLECTVCRSDARKLWTSNRKLYISALWANVRNNLGLGSLTYYMTMRHVCRPLAVLSAMEQVHAAVGITIVEAILYYSIHRAFHEVKGLYWMHSYHHQFNTIVLPSSANAVSVAEYVFAYMIPLVIAVWLTRADEVAAFGGSAIVGIANILIHTPALEHYPFPSPFVVSATDHLSHHRKTLRANYGAPVFHVDRILAYASSIMSPAEKQQPQQLPKATS